MKQVINLISLLSFFIFIGCSTEHKEKSEFNLQSIIDTLTSKQIMNLYVNESLIYYVRSHCSDIIEYRNHKELIHVKYIKTDSIYTFHYYQDSTIVLDISNKTDLLYLLKSLSFINSNGFDSKSDHALIYLDYSDSLLCELKQNNPIYRENLSVIFSESEKEHYEKEVPYKYVLLNIFDKSNIKIVDYYKKDRTLHKINDNWYYFRSFSFSSCPKFSPGED